MIPPPAFHAPPLAPGGASHSGCAGPPVTSIFLSLLPEKNPMKRLSGDQKRKVASSVPASGCAVSELSSRTHSRVLPSEVPRRATRLPSGETVKGPLKVAFSGG